jgi:hypothetical protein
MVFSTVFAERAVKGLIEGLFQLLCMWRGIRKELRCFRAPWSQLINKTFFSKLCCKRCFYELSLRLIYPCTITFLLRIIHPQDFETLGQIIPDRYVLTWITTAIYYQKLGFPWARICKRLWSPGIDSARVGIDSWTPKKVYKYGLWVPFGCIILSRLKVQRTYNPRKTVRGQYIRGKVVTILLWLLITVVIMIYIIKGTVQRDGSGRK